MAAWPRRTKVVHRAWQSLIGEADLDARSAARRGDEHSEESISPGAPYKTKGYIIYGVALRALGRTMGSNLCEIAIVSLLATDKPDQPSGHQSAPQETPVRLDQPARAEVVYSLSGFRRAWLENGPMTGLLPRANIDRRQ